MYRHLLRYNFRICAGLGPWLLVVPVGATMLVLFGLMSLASLVRSWTPAVVVEVLGPLLLAFVGANLLRPEYQYNSLETILTRPISFRTILSVRVLFAALGVLALEALICLYMALVMHVEFNVPIAMLAAGVSMAFLASLAVAVAAAWRSPTLGVAAAAGVWALDLIVGPALNPVVTLRGYAQAVARPQEWWDAWILGKGVLAALAVVLILAAAKAARQPAAQRTIRRLVRSVIAIVLIATLYVASGAAYKVHWCREHEAMLVNRSRFVYRQAFRVYGPLPVAYLFGPAFARFVGYRPPWVDLPPGGSQEITPERQYDLDQLKQVAFGHPNSVWADNALYELGRALGAEGEGATVDRQTSRLGMECFEALVDGHPDSPFAPAGLARLSHLYEQVGQREESDEAGRRLLTLYPANEAAWETGELLLERYWSEDRLQDAHRVAEKLAANGPEDDRPDALVELGAVLAALGRRAQAEQRLNEAVAEASRLIMGIAEEEKTLDDISRMRQLSGARRRAQEELEALRAGK
jgi:tetratricopeptide (TPR) repeat protein